MNSFSKNNIASAIPLMILLACSATRAQDAPISVDGVSTTATRGSTVDVEFFLNSDNPITVFDYSVRLEIDGPNVGTDVRIDSCGDTNSTEHAMGFPLEVLFVDGLTRCFGSTFNFSIIPGAPIPPPFELNDDDGLMRMTLDISRDAAPGEYTISALTDRSVDTAFLDANSELLGFTTSSATLTIVDALRGDMNNDRVLNNLDINAFALALTNLGEYETQFPGVDPIIRGDVNSDGAFNNLDIGPFADLLTATPPPTTIAVPEPKLSLWMLVGMLWLFKFRCGQSPKRNSMKPGMTTSPIVLSISCVAFMFAIGAESHAVLIGVSDSDTDKNSTAGVSLPLGETIDLFIWVEPDVDQGINGLSFDLGTSTPGIVQAVGADIHNPPVSLFDRWTSVTASPVLNSGNMLVENANAVSLAGSIGISSSVIAGGFEGLIAQTNGAVVHATISIQATSIGETILLPAVGDSLITDINGQVFPTFEGIKIEVSAVPEPSSYMMVLMAAALVMGRRWYVVVASNRHKSLESRL